MAIDHHPHDRIVANPGEVVGATIPGQPETREGHNNTHEVGSARLATRRNFLRALAGAGALVLAGGAAALVMDSDERVPAITSTAEIPANPYPAFEAKDLTMNNLKMPETLDKKTYAEIISAMGEAIQYAVNSGDRTLIRRLIPGGLTGTEGTIQPGQFELRAAFIKGFRETAGGTGNDHPDDPQNQRYYTWGFSMQSLDVPHPLDSPPEHVTGYSGLVRITMGDLPPLPTLTHNELNMEPPQTFDATIELTRYAIDDAGNSSVTPNIISTAAGGWEVTEDKGWAFASIDKMYPIPSIMAANYESFGFTETPPLFKQS